MNYKNIVLEIPKFTDLLKEHTEKRQRRRSDALEYMIESFMLTTGLKIHEIELVETTSTNEISWSVREKKTQEVEMQLDCIKF